MTAICVPRFLSISLTSTSAFSRSMRAIWAAWAFGSTLPGLWGFRPREAMDVSVVGEVDEDMGGKVESVDREGDRAELEDAGL